MMEKKRKEPILQSILSHSMHLWNVKSEIEIL